MDIGSVFIDISDIIADPAIIIKLCQYAANMVYYASLKAPYIGQYTEELAKRDFDIIANEVCNYRFKFIF